jgi:hypothetical protein
MEQSLDDVYIQITDREFLTLDYLLNLAHNVEFLRQPRLATISLPNLYRGLFLQDYFELNPQVNDTDPSIVPIG